MGYTEEQEEMLFNNRRKGILRIPLTDGMEITQHYSDIEVGYEVKEDCVELKVTQTVKTIRIGKLPHHRNEAL